MDSSLESPKAQQIEVAGRAVRVREPGRYQHRALESKSVAMRRLTQPIEQTLPSLPRDHEIERLASFSRQFEETRAD